jgi:hypothetical protein
MLERIVIRRSPLISASEWILSIWASNNVKTVDEARAATANWFIREDCFDELWNRYRRGGATMGNAASDKKNTRCFSLKLSRNTDKDLIRHLESQENIQAYIKQLIREDMKRASR